MAQTKRVGRYLAAVEWTAFFTFTFGLGFIFSIASYSDIGAFLTTGTLSFHQLFSKSVTGNWFSDRFGRSGVLRYDEAKAQPGYTLYTLAPDLSAHLIDMNGREIHRWFVPKEKVMPEAIKSARTFFGFLEPQVEGGHLFPNGDLLLVYEIKSLGIPATPLVKLNKDSQIIWRTEVKSHHSIQVVGDKIFALTGTFTRPVEKAIPGARYRPYMGERVSVLDSEGRALSSHSILQAIANSKSLRLAEQIPLDPRADAVHSNSLDVLTDQTARSIPGAKPGNVLLSLRNLDMLVVLDLESDQIVWALRGGWRKQHDAKVLRNGHILLFDNEGGLRKSAKSRVLEVDPRTGGVIWSYEGTDNDPLDSSENRGGAQRLTGGNTLISEANAGRILELTPDGQVVWEYVNALRDDENGKKLIASLGLTVTRYDRSYLSFLGKEDHYEPPHRDESVH
jgi:hypothetical protein